MKRVIRVGVALAMLILTLGTVAAQPSTDPVEPQEGCTFFEETGHNLCAEFEAYWNGNGGLPVFGYPITEAAPEVNPDLNVELLTQWFERNRFELHPENAGTPYHVLLGRLGNEVLLAMGEDWMTFPKGDPNADHYFAETGHAIAPEFWNYWASHGLDLGDEGISFRESLALFGYPISEPAMETNSSDDTVLTQWFERARFEYHPDNPEGQQVLLGLLGNELLATEEPPAGPPAAGEVIADGLMGPRGLDAMDDGTVYVTESGAAGDQCVEVPGEEGEEPFEVCIGPTSAVTRIAGGEQTQVVTGLPSVGAVEEPAGAQDVVADADGTLHIIIGLGADPAAREMFGDAAALTGYLVTATDGEVTPVVDVAAYESESNPDGGLVDSNPFSLVMNSDGSYVVSDAGMNALVNVAADGTITTLATFESRMVDAPPFLELPEGEQIPMESVPTGVTKGPDGNYYAGELTGFPFVPGAARVWQVTPEGEATVYAEGFTNILDVAFDAAGNLYVLEMVHGGLLNANPEDLSTAVGAIIKVSPDGTQETVVDDGIFVATGMDIAADGTIYVSDLGIVPGMGRVQAIEGVAEPAPPGPEVVAEGLNNPRGIAVTDDGTLYVAEAGVTGDQCQELPFRAGEDPFEVCVGPTSQITMVAGGEQSPVVTGLPSVGGTPDDATGAHDVVVGDEGTLYSVVGLGSSTIQRFRLGDAGALLGHLISTTDGEVTPLADVAMYETEANPDGGLVDSNPFSLVMNADGSFVVSDAGMNALVTVTAEGEISTLATFAERMVDAPEFLGLPEGTQIPMQAVPTGVTVGPDGNYYVGELTGFPFEPGAARVWQVTPDGEATVYAEGFTNVIDVAFDADGNLYVLEMIKGGLLNADPEDPATAAAQLTRVAPDGTQTPLPSNGLIFATGLAVGPDGSIYVSNFGVMPGMGQVVRIATAS